MTGDAQQPRGRRLSSWTTRRWLRVGVGASLVVLTLLGVTGAWVMGRSQSISNNLTDVRSPSLSTAFRLETALVNQETGIRGYGLTGIPGFLAPYRQGVADQKAYTRSLEELLDGDTAGLHDLASVQEAVDRWQEDVAEPVAAAPAGTPSPQEAERLANGKAAFDEVRAALESQQERLRADRVQARADLQSTITLRNWVFGAIALLIVVLAALVFEAAPRYQQAPGAPGRRRPHHRRGRLRPSHHPDRPGRPAAAQR